jgi:acyl-CoA thioester hydrolase
MSEYRYEVEIPVRYRDLDPLGHVNNAVYATYLEQARTSYIDDVIGTPPEELGLVVANLELDFDRSITFREQVTVGLRTTDIGTSSVTMDYEVRSDDGVAATASSVIVTLDDDGTPYPVPEAVRQRIVEHEGL